MDIFIIIYLNNILVTLTICSYIVSILKKVLKWLYKVGFYIKAKKYKFYSKLVKYLEYILFSSKLTMLDNKVKIIQDWLKLKKVKNIQFFLGFANFYYWFIFNYSDIVILLIYLIWKNIFWKFNNFCHNIL